MDKFLLYHTRLNVSYQIKGYLHSKMITSQNVPSKAQVKIFFFV